nr:transcription factor bHLH36-like [Ipomoea batatas]
MEQISSTFPFQDGLLHFSPISARQQTRPPVSDHNNNPLLVFDLLKGDEDVVPTMKHNVVLQQHQQLQRNPNNPHQERKIIRRDVERQRRKEMGGLYKSLVGLIPYEYIKVVLCSGKAFNVGPSAGDGEVRERSEKEGGEAEREER